MGTGRSACIALCLLFVLGACGSGGGGGSQPQSQQQPQPQPQPQPLPPPTVTLSSSATSVAAGGAVTLTWSSTNASSCTASGGWTGSRGTSGSEQVGQINAVTTFTLTCGTDATTKSESVVISIVAPVAAGIASYRNVTVTPDPSSAIRYSMQLDLAAFDATTYQPASILSLKPTSRNLLVPGGSQVLGVQTYTLQSINCTQGSVASTYDALMLFDRSGSMLSNDPQDDTLVAAREFINRMDVGGRAWVAAFPGGNPGRPTNPVTFYGSGFTSNQAQLLADVGSVGSPNGGTPLWDSMDLSLTKFPLVPAGGNTRALLSFSDGEDQGSTVSSPGSVTSSALARGAKVFAINLRNSNSQSLDAIALATGGSVYSTDDAKKLVAFYGTLGKLLSGQATHCSATIDVAFAPGAGAGEVGYGPGSGVKSTLDFDAESSSGDVLVETEISFPFYPGRRLGQTSTLRSVYETDIAPAVNTVCVDLAQGSARNVCNATVWFAICDATNPTRCNRGAVPPGGTLPAFGSITYAQCRWNEPHGKYESVQQSGTAPNQLFTPSDGAGSGYLCVNAARGPF